MSFCRKDGEEGDRIRGGILGLGTLMAVAVFSHGFWSGCRTAEILAINDDGMDYCCYWTCFICNILPLLHVKRYTTSLIGVHSSDCHISGNVPAEHQSWGLEFSEKDIVLV